MDLRLRLLGVFGLVACGPDVAPTPADSDSDTESGSGESGVPATEGSTTVEPTTDESGESGDESSSSSGDVEPAEEWCVDVHWVEPLSGVAALDIDGDGRVELWTASSDWDPIAGVFTTSFVSRALDGEVLVDVVELSRGGSFFEFADIDGDGRSDAIIEPELGAGPHFLRGTATGELDETPLPITGFDPVEDGQLLDVTGDGAADLLRIVDGFLQIHVNDGEGAFTLGGTHEVDGEGWSDVAFSFEGELVLTVSPFCDFCVSDTEVIVLSVAPDGTPTEQRRATPGGSVQVIDARDRDGDGDRDLFVSVFTESQDVHLSWLDGDSLAEDIVLAPETFRFGADFDLDGTIDAVDELGVRWGLEDGTFAEPEPLHSDVQLDGWNHGDFDLDGRADFYVSNMIWSVEACDGPYEEPEEPEELEEAECGNGRVEANEECDGSADCSDECIFADAVIWTTVHDGANLPDCGHAIAVAPGGDIYVTGEQGTENSGSQLLVLALDASGDALWSDTYQATLGFQSDQGTGIAVAADGDVIVSGNVYNELSWLRRYTPEGGIVWTEQTGSLELEIGSANAMVLDGDRLPVIVGNAEGTAWLGAYDADGLPRWDRLHDDDGLGSDFTTVALDDAGNLVAFGRTDGRSLAASFDADGAPRWNVVSPYPSDNVVTGAVAPDGRAWVVQRDEYSAPDEWVVRTLDPTGAPAGAFVISTDGLRDILGITFDPEGDAIFVGDRDGAAWIRRVHDDGALVWERSFGQDDIIGGSTALRDAVVDADGSIVVTGCLDGDLLVRRFAP